VVISTIPFQIFPAGLSLLRAASLAVTLVGYLLFFCTSDRLKFVISLFITGAYLYAIDAPFLRVFYFYSLEIIDHGLILDYGSCLRNILLESIGIPIYRWH
jgi:hypothetical protein